MREKVVTKVVKNGCSNIISLCFIMSFIGIFPFYAINLSVVSLFADSPFTFLVMFVSDVLYRF